MINKRNKKYIIIFLALVLVIIIPFTYSKYIQKFSRKVVINAIQPTYTVVFNPNGGSGIMEEQEFTYGISENLNANTFVRTNYSFDSWNTESNGSGTSYTNEQLVNNITSTDGAIINLYAQWKENIIVTFDSNGGIIPAGDAWTGSGSTATKYINTSTYGDMPEPTKNGYTFLGWSDNTDNYTIYNLPNEYQQVEYIESTGTQYIDIEVIPTNITGVYSRLSSSDISSDLIYFGLWDNGSRFWVANTNNKIYYGWNDNTFRNEFIEAGTIYNVSLNYLNNRKEYLDEEVINNNIPQLNSINKSIYVFAANNNGTVSYKSSIKLYELKISEGTSITHNYVPCYRKNDNVIGLYDTIEHQFYENLGTGTFNKGNDIKYIVSTTQVVKNEDHTLYANWQYNPMVTFNANGGTVDSPNKRVYYNSNYGELPIPTKSGYTFIGWATETYQQVEYIESTGTQYINTKVIPSNTKGLYGRLSSSNISNDAIYFGSRGSGNRFWIANNKNKIYYGWNDNTFRDEYIEVGTIYNVSLNYLNNRKEYLNEEVIKSDLAQLKSNNNAIFVFAANDGTTGAAYKSSIKLYELKISDGNDIIRNFIPCYRNSDNVIGLYDLVESIFYINEGTGTFGKSAKEGSTIIEGNYITSTTKVLKNEDHTLYAVWEENITFTTDGNSEEWTNQDVTLTINPNIPARVSEYSFDGGNTWQDSPSKTYTENTSNIVTKVKDNKGNIIDGEIINITKIDKVLPTLNINNDIIVTLSDSHSVDAYFTSSDSESGIKENSLKIYRKDISLGQCTDEITNTNYFDYPGLYAVEVEIKDNAGNIKTIDDQILVRWPTGGRYVVKKTELDGAGIAGTGLSSTTSPNGLYKDNASTGGNIGLPFASKYYYTGPVVDNYLSFAGLTFRILNVSTNDNIKVLGDISDTKVRWGPSYETSNRKIYESNTYNTWSTKWWPRGQIYNNETGEGKYKLFTDTEKAHLALATFYAGRFNKSDAPDIAYTVYYEQTGGVNLGGENDTNPAFEGYSAYPNVSDYLKASKAHDVAINIDDTQDDGILGIGTTKREIFNDNSWIDMSIDQWTMNSKNATSTDNDYWVIDGTTKGRIVSRTFYYEQQYRVVFYLTDTTILSGDGSSDNPYTVEEDWSWFDDIQVLQ